MTDGILIPKCLVACKAMTLVTAAALSGMIVDITSVINEAIASPVIPGLGVGGGWGRS